jgi:glycosyltransferase involved in cell wall biosynthesis
MVLIILFFKKTIDSFLFREIVKVNPDIIIYNFCYMDFLKKVISILQMILPHTVHIIRFHHELRTIIKTPLRESILSLADITIVPSDYMIQEIKDYSCKKFTVPFGVNIDKIETYKNDNKKYDFISSMNSYKNSDLLKEIFSRLEKLDYSTLNILGADKTTYYKVLSSSRIYLTTSLSEGGASRSLLEAVAAGCYPICDDICIPVSKFIKEIGGSSIFTGVKVDDSIVTNNEKYYDNIISNLISIHEKVKNGSLKCKSDIIHRYDEKMEFSQLETILSLKPNKVKTIITNFCEKIGNNFDFTKLNDPLYRQHSKDVTNFIFKFLNFHDKYQWGFEEQIFTKKFNFIESLDYIIKETN